MIDELLSVDKQKHDKLIWTFLDVFYGSLTKQEEKGLLYVLIDDEHFYDYCHGYADVRTGTV